MASTGIARIDQLFAAAGAAPIQPGDSDSESVGVIQDFLIGHGHREVPGVLGAARGSYGPKTTEAVRAFRHANGLPDSPAVDQPVLRAMVATPSAQPIASCGYVALALDTLFAGMVRLVGLTAQFEGAGRFAAMNRNTDRAGLSFGLIQWAQKPGRLTEILRAFRAADAALFARIFADGDTALADRLVAHTAKERGGTDNSGKSIDARFELAAEPWTSRFLAAGRNKTFQSVQLATARAAFEASTAKIRAFAPALKSERAFAFMLDVANQHGDGGAKSIFQASAAPAMSEGELLSALERESVARVAAQFGAGSAEARSTQSRRQAFRTSAILSDAPLAV